MFYVRFLGSVNISRDIWAHGLCHDSHFIHYQKSTSSIVLSDESGGLVGHIFSKRNWSYFSNSQLYLPDFSYQD